MQNQAYDELARVEDAHWYHAGRRKLVDHYIGSIREDLGRDARILDVGCGTGGMFDLLERYGSVTGLELSDHAARLCLEKHPSTDIVTGSANELGTIFAGRQFDLVAFFNVLYHEWITDDAQVLREAASLIRPGGFVIVNEPAYMFLYRDNDKICLGKRRYARSTISALLSQAGFCTVRSTYFNSVSLLPLCVLTALQRAGMCRTNEASDELRLPPPAINGCLSFAMASELAWIRRFGGFPFGVSILTLGRKDPRP